MPSNAFRYRALLRRLLGRDLGADDAVSRERLTTAESRLRLTLPETVADFYRRAGAAPELQAHNRLRAPEALEIDEGFLIFMEENQNVVEWGFRVPVADDVDPNVWQRVNDAESAWFSEDMSFSAFIVRNLAFTQGVELADDDLLLGGT